MQFTINPAAVADLGLPEKLGQMRFELDERPTYRDLEAIERATKVKYDDWSSLMSQRVTFYLSIRHVDHTLLTWNQMVDFSPADFIEVTEADDAADSEEAEDAEPAVKDPNSSPSASVPEV